MKPSRFTQEQRDEAVAKYLKNKSKREAICKKMKISESCLYKWKADYKKRKKHFGPYRIAEALKEEKKAFDLLKKDFKEGLNGISLDFKHTSISPFEQAIQYRLTKTNELLLEKGREYVRGEDRFHNFVRAAEMNRETPTRALHGMLTKHLISMLDILDDIDKGILPTKEKVEEKFGDIVVYVMLQEALIKDKYLKK